MRANWIDVNESLPKFGRIVLVWSILDKECVSAFLMNDKNWSCWPVGGTHYTTKTDITHWMELPEFPEFTLGELINNEMS